MAVRGQPVEHSAARADLHAFDLRRRLPVLFAVFATFFIVAAVRSPVPGVGEPHYLSKAKHYWQPGWCERDLFLSSSNPHVAFYAGIGWLTQVCSLPCTAWIGRVASQLLLAFGWTTLLSRLAAGRWTPLWTAWGFLGLASLGTLAGEWIVGGVEGKVFSYAFLFLSLAAALDRRWVAGAVWGGASVSFHSIVGIWGLSALAFTIVARRLTSRKSSLLHSKYDFPDNAPAGLPGSGRVGFFRPAFIGLLLVICSLPGLLPSLAVVLDPASNDSFAANYIQVFYRLSHHLNPNEFSPLAAAGYVAMLAATWSILKWSGDPDESFAMDCIRWYLLAVCLIAVAGAIIGLGPIPTARTAWQGLRMTLMKFYPFRLFDVVVPMAFALVLADQTARWWRNSRRTDRDEEPSHGSHAGAGLWLAWSLPLVLSLTYLPGDRNPSRLDATELIEWKGICGWIDAHVPQDALVCTPYGAWAFKWYAQRAEFVSFKDCPQDTPGIIEWNRRLKYLDEWGSRSFEDGYTVHELQQLRDDTGCSHWLTYRASPVHAAPIHQRGAFRIYDLRALAEVVAE